MDLRSVRRKKRAARALTWVSAAVIIACMAGLIVGLILMGTGNGNTARENLFLIIGGCCLAVLLIAALASVGFYRLSEKYESQETDLRERACSENSFFAGDDLLATFGADGVRFHAALDARGKISREVRVPYKDMKIYSIINRRSPRAKGESVVLLEIPTRFFSKGRNKTDDEAPALVRLDGKERLFHALGQYGAEVLGLRHEPKEKETLTPLFTVSVPVKEKRSRAVMGAVGGAVVILVGAALAIWVNLAVGVAVACLGVLFAVRSAVAAVRAKDCFVVYREGFYWKDANRYERMFLYADEVARIGRKEHEGKALVEFDCVYAPYYYADTDGLYDRLKEAFPEKCGEEQ